jgi:hypothetical protein
MATDRIGVQQTQNSGAHPKDLTKLSFWQRHVSRHESIKMRSEGAILK